MLVLSHLYPVPYNPALGIFVHQQVKALQKTGAEIRVVAPIAWAPYPIKHLRKKWKAYADVPEQRILEGIHVYHPTYLTYPLGCFFTSAGVRMHLGIRDTVTKIYREFPFDLIHAHVALPDGYAASIIAKDFDCSFVITIHGQDFLATIPRSNLSKKLINQAFHKASAIMMVSNKLKDLGYSFFPEEYGKMFVVPNGIDPEIVKSCSESDGQSTIYKHNHGPSIVSVSFLIKRKGMDVNIRAIQKLRERYPDIEYTVIGYGQEYNALRELTKSLGLENHIRFVGQVEHEKVLRYINNCDVFSLPSWDEAFGVVYIEAMACGKPVIGCRGEGIEDFVEHGKTGILVKPRDVAGLTEALDYLLSHPEEASAIGKRARKVVFDKYTWAENAEKTMEIYKNVLA